MNKRRLALPMLLAMLAMLCGCAASEGYVMRPEDKMLYFQKGGDAFITNADSLEAISTGADAGIMNTDTVPLADGSLYYTQNGKLYYKPYFGDAVTISDDAGNVFLALGNYYVLDSEGQTLYSITNDNKLKKILGGIGGAPQNRFLESSTNFYAIADGGVYRLPYGADPEKLVDVANHAEFVNEDSNGVYFEVDKKLYYIGHKAVSANVLLKDFTPLQMGAPVSGASCTAYADGDGGVHIYSFADRKSSETLYTLPDSTGGEGLLLPELTKTPAAFVAENMYALISDGTSGTLPVDFGGAAHFDGKCFYGNNSGTLTVFDTDTAKLSYTEIYSPALRFFPTPEGCYAVADSGEAYGTAMYKLENGGARLIADGIRSDSQIRCGYGYAGIYFITEKGLFVYDEQENKVDALMEIGGLADFMPRMSAIYVLYDNGNLDILRQEESASQPISQGVDALYLPPYSPMALRLFLKV